VRNEVRKVCARSWRGLLGLALAALVGVMLAAAFGNGPAARFAGTIAFTTALAGAISGLVGGAGLEGSRES